MNETPTRREALKAIAGMSMAGSAALSVLSPVSAQSAPRSLPLSTDASTPLHLTFEERQRRGVAHAEKIVGCLVALLTDLGTASKSDLIAFTNEALGDMAGDELADLPDLGVKPEQALVLANVLYGDHLVPVTLSADKSCGVIANLRSMSPFMAEPTDDSLRFFMDAVAVAAQRYRSNLLH